MKPKTDFKEAATFPTCFSEFHEQALKPVCGHPLFDELVFCFNLSRVRYGVSPPSPPKGFYLRKGFTDAVFGYDPGFAIS